MAKATFYHLPAEKQQQILLVCKKEFEQHPISKAKVSNIVATLGIARGSFYQYFEDIEECYFTILRTETTETHELFARILAKEKELFPALEIYGKTLAEELFEPERYALYRNRYLFWTPELDAKWKAFRSREGTGERPPFTALQTRHLRIEDPALLPELISYLKAVVHELIRRIFLEDWTAEDFLQHFTQQMHWLKNGLYKEEKE